MWHTYMFFLSFGRFNSIEELFIQDMRFFFCCQYVRPLCQIQLHEKRQLAGWLWGSEEGVR